MINISNQDESSSYLSTQSPYFIDAFFIIGFEIEPLNNDLNRYLIDTSQITSQTFGMYKYSNKPTIINSIYSNGCDTMLNEDTLINQIFPETPNIYFNQKGFGSTYSVLFKQYYKKEIYFGYAYIFYENIIIKKDIVGNIPKAFCVISHYPYFSFYKYFCKKILNNFVNENMIIPSEILAYNVINSLPSPNNSQIVLESMSKYISGNFGKDYEISQMNCFPMIDINVIEIFNKLSLRLFIKIFFLHFLEFKVVLFSKNIELANIVIYLIHCFEYPFDNEKEEIITISSDKLSTFNSSFYPTCFSVNQEYKSGETNVILYSNHIEVDLDKDIIEYYIEKSQSSSSYCEDDVFLLFEFMEKILIGKKKYSCPLENIILRLYNNLEVLIKNKKSKGSLWTINKDSQSQNKKMQHFFYKSILRIFSVFSFHAKKTEGSIPYMIEYKENISNVKEERNFYNLLKTTKKYDNFIVMRLGKIDNDKISTKMAFFDEFCQMLQKEPEIHIDFFHIQMSITKQKTTKISFSSLTHYYIDIIKNEINDIMLNSNNFINYTISKGNESQIGFQYKSYVFDKEILIRYLYHLDNLSLEKITELFPLMSVNELNISKQSNSLSTLNIIDSIELFFIIKNKLKIPNLVRYICLYIAGIISDKIYIENQFNLLKELIRSLKFFIKKYSNFLLIVLINIINKKKEQKLNIDKELELYSLLFEVIIQNNIIPNKEMHSYIKTLNQYTKSDSSLRNTRLEIVDIPYQMELIGNFPKNTDKNPKKIIALLDKTKNSDDFIYTSTSKDISICPIIHISFDNKTKKASSIFTPLKLYRECMKIVNDYLNHEEIKNADIISLIINVLFYIKYTDELNNFPTQFLVFYLYMMTSIE